MDLESILKPISEDNPVGVNLRDDQSPLSSYNKLKDARNNARAAERNNIFDPSDSTASEQWRIIFNLAPAVASKEAKDLEVISWYIEALTRSHGFDGLLLGFQALSGLIEQFWDDLYPLPDDEDGIETKVAAITGLNGVGAEGVLISPIRNISITDSQSAENFSLWQYQQAVEIQKISDDRAREERAASAGFNIDDIHRAVNSTSDEALLKLKDTIQSCKKEYKQISQMLDEHCGEHSPPSSNMINVLEDCESAVNYLFKDRLAILAEQNNLEEDNENFDATDATAKPKSTSTGEIKTREDAFQHILEISAFFRRTEPHSPVSYVLEKAVKWGRMPLDQLIPELIADGGALEQYRNLTGMFAEDDK